MSMSFPNETIEEMRDTLGAVLAKVTQLSDQIDRMKQKEYVYGIRGLAKLLNCSTTTALHIRQTGYLDNAISSAGRPIAIDKSYALKLYQEHKIKIDQRLRINRKKINEK